MVQIIYNRVSLALYNINCIGWSILTSLDATNNSIGFNLHYQQFSIKIIDYDIIHYHN
ncbi:MAG: hypothetical protein ACKESC_01920 [Candidatus Hodgkinia cicadicola]